MDWIEPVWKMMLSNKAILPVLWELFPGHPNLLPSFFDRQGGTYVKKPLAAGLWMANPRGWAFARTG